MKIELDHQLTGNETLHRQHGPQARLDEFLRIFSGISMYFPIAFIHLEFIRLDFDDHRNFHPGIFGIYAKNDAFHRADLNALEQHRRAHVQPLDGAVEDTERIYWSS